LIDPTAWPVLNRPALPAVGRIGLVRQVENEEMEQLGARGIRDQLIQRRPFAFEGGADLRG